MPSRPAPLSRSPGTSRLELRPRLSARVRAANGTSIAPTGTLIQKIQCQSSAEITAPPTSGPSATAVPLIPDQTPSAMPRRSAENVSARRVSVSGVTIAAPTP